MNDDLKNMMTPSEQLAIGAHLSVLLRRKVGRVIDVEWMVKSREYAQEVIRVCRADEEHADLQAWATKLELALDNAASWREAKPAVVPVPEAPPPIDRAAPARYVKTLR